MRGYARQFGENEEQWGIVGLLHDFDYERYHTPADHPFRGCDELRRRGYPEWVMRATRRDALASDSECGTVMLERLTLPVSGTYTVLVDPASWDTDTATLRLSDIVDVTGSVTVGGSAVPVSVTVSLLRPDGTTLTSKTSSSTNFNLTTQTLPSTGTYTVLVNPAGTSTGTITITVTSP